MSSDWPIFSFENAPFKIVDGDRGANYPKQDEFSAAGFCLFLNTGNVTIDGFKFNECAFITDNKDRLLRKGKLIRGDVVLTTRGTLGNVGFFSSKVIFENIRINSGMVILRADETQILPYYLFLFLRSASFVDQVKSFKSGSAQPQLPIRDMQRIELPIPSIQNQENICSVISALDDRIALLRETNATLEAIAQALFKSWFVDFDPVRAKQDGREPVGMDTTTAALFPDSFEESELGLVPSGWITGKFGDVLTETTSRVKQCEATVLSAVRTGNLVCSDEHFNKRVYSEDIAKYKIVKPLSFAYNPSRINIGSIGLNEFNNFGAVSPIYVVMEPKTHGSAYLIWHHLRTEVVRNNITNLASGTVRQSLSFSDFASIPLIVPNDELLNSFLALRTSIYEKISANNNVDQTLTTLRDTLLPRLISGQLRVPEAASLLEKIAA